MDAIVVYESVYGNTRAIAEAVAEGLGGVPVLPVHEADERRTSVELLVVGGPTHVHGLATTRSRSVGAHTGEHDGAAHVEPDAAEEPGLRAWIGGLSPDAAHHAAAFDTRLDRPAWLTGSAARGIARRLRRRGIEIVDAQSFVVKEAEGPLEAGELERAREWGARLAQSVSTGSRTAVETSA